jgi:UDP-N-acetylmuramoyl-L-alanyl-D-glutamate--2,6-diaminopimelate ligase
MQSTEASSLERLFEGQAATIHGERGLAVTSIATDSRRVRPGALFFCLRGQHADGHAFAREAVAAGAAAVVADRDLRLGSLTTVIVADPLAALSHVAAQLYDRPSESLRTIGVTGTNGKTTTTHFIESIARASGERFGVIGTLGARIADVPLEDLTNTTPFAHDIQRLLARFRDAGAQGAILEVSSHALALHRVDDVGFDIAVLTNLTHDHLDFHRNFDEYRETKRTLFTAARGKSGTPPVAVLNLDDDEGKALAGLLASKGNARVLTYAIDDPEAMLRATDLTMDATGSRFEVKALRPAPLSIRLPGRFNVSNAMAALAAGVALDADIEAIAEGLESLEHVPGRMTTVPAGDIGVYVDYAHTPDGMEKILRATRALTRGRLFCVFGCGGDRDPAKRPQMGRLAQALADEVILTTDNPRHEDPQAVLRDILAGMQPQRCEVIADRAAAIERAVLSAAPGDCIVIAGKGHENYQLVGDERRPFSDVDAARAAIVKRRART